MNFYPTSTEPVPTPAVRSRPWGDLYLNLQAFDRNGANATLRVIVEPLTPWIWTGGFIICLGALVSVGGARQRQPAPVGARERRPAAPVAGPELGEVAS